MQRLVSVDERKRITLGTMATHDQYIATTFEDGRIVFEPAVVITKAEERIADDPAFWERVAAASAETATLVPADLFN